MSISRIDQRDMKEHVIARTSQAAFHHMPHSERLSDLAKVARHVGFVRAVPIRLITFRSRILTSRERMSS